MTENQSTNRQILKATSIFGSVHVFNLVISLIRSKFIAVIIGANGVGIIGLFNSVLTLIGSFASNGLETSIVKNISAAQDDDEKLLREVSIAKKIIWVIGALGMLLMLIFSPLLSKITFGNYDYTFGFGILSITLLFRQLASGSFAILRGLHKIKYLAKANFYGNVLGVIVSLPLYYFFKIDAIVPSIVISSFLSLLIAVFFEKKLKLTQVQIPNQTTWNEGRKILSLGFSLGIISLLTALSSYLFQIFIGFYSTISEVGLYSAGFTILTTYVGIIFTAMATDYYPRLAKISGDNTATSNLVQQQATMSVLILTPIIVVFLSFAPIIIRILYSKEFLPIVSMVSWGILGMLIKAISFSMGYVLIANADSKLFLKTSLFFNSFFLIINILSYYYYGLEGVGIAFIVNHFIHFFVLKIILQKKYSLELDSKFYRLIASCCFICTAAFLAVRIEDNNVRYASLFVLILFSAYFSIKQMNKRVDFKSLFKQKKNT